MARLLVKFIDVNDKANNITIVKGAKQTKTWLRKTYGKDSEEVNNDYYFVSGKNEYGIKWLIKSYSRRFDTYYWNFVSDPKYATKHAARSSKIKVTIL